MNRKTRRQFLRTVGQVGAVSMAAQMTRLAPLPLFAQGPDYKALVCVFLFGGNDSNNMIVPIDNRYAAYETMRGGLFNATSNPTSVALPLSSVAARNAGSTGYGFHPSLVNLHTRYNQSDQRVAMVFNVGTLHRPMTRQQYRDGSVTRPSNLYSHSDQTQQWQTSIPTGGGTGWGGRLNDVTSPVFNTMTALPPGITVQGGSAMFLNGVNTQGLNYSNPNSFGLTTFSGPTTARLAALQNILVADTGVQLVGAANGVLGSSLANAQAINAALASAPAIPAGITFPNTGLGNQLRQIAQIISIHASPGVSMNRQIFFAGTGGFDNHENLITSHANLMNGFDQAVDAFVKTLEARGQYNQVTLFTESEFNRTANNNASAGTDHAWGSHCFVVGGAVNGGVHGTFPVHQLNGPDDAGDRGYWIPTTSTDQYGATLGRWFGASGAQLNTVFPNLGNFPEGLLSFV